MNTKIKKRIVSVVAFMSLVVSLVGFLPVSTVRADTFNVPKNVYYQFSYKNGSGIETTEYDSAVGSSPIYKIEVLDDNGKVAGRCLVSKDDFTCTAYTVNSKKSYSQDMTTSSVKCSHYSFYLVNLTIAFDSTHCGGFSTIRQSYVKAEQDKNGDHNLWHFLGEYLYHLSEGKSDLSYITYGKDSNSSLNPYFYLASSQAKRNSVLSSYWNCKWGLTWKLPNNVDHSGYYLDVCVSNNATKGDKVSICDASKQTIPVSKRYYSFWTNPQVRDAMMSCWSDWRPNKKNVFYVYARVKNKSGVASDWTIFQCYPNGTIGTVYGRSDANWDKTEEFKGETGSYSDGTKTDANGSYYVPDSGYDPSGETDDSGYKKDYSWKDDVSGVDNGTIDKSSFMGLLNDCINSIGNVPAILSQLVPWIPDDIISLICVAFGFIVVVGVIKWVL